VLALLRRLALPMVALLLALPLVPSVAPAAAQQGDQPWTGDLPPDEGGFALLVTAADRTPAALTRDLQDAGCNVVTLAVTDEGEWVVYVAGAPGFVNEPFPADLASGSVFALSCGGPDRPLVLTLADRGRQVSLPAGGLLHVVLPANPHLGYEWRADPAPDAGILVEDEEPSLGAPAGPIAAPVSATFAFAAEGPGTADLRLVYVRASDQSPSPVEEWQVTVTVRD
jgi:predicted secreted protein